MKKLMARLGENLVAGEIGKVEGFTAEALKAGMSPHEILERGMMPVVAETEKDAVNFALKQCYLKDVATARIIRIKNTLVLDDIWVSPAVLEEIKDQDHIEVMDEISDLVI